MSVSDSAVPRKVLLITSGGAFVAFLDVTILNLAFPDLRRDFHRVLLTDLSWVVTLYAVCLAACLTPAGRLGDVLGRRRLFVVGAAIFAAGSVASALAVSLPMLIVARAVQGIGAAATIPTSLALLLAATPEPRQSSAVGLWGASSGVAAAIGPTLGGSLVTAFGWRAVFWINVPLCVALIFFARRIPETRAQTHRLPDLVGTMLLAGGIGLAVLGATDGATWAWSSSQTIASLGGGIALILVAVWRSFGHPAPALDVGLWRCRPFAIANLVSLMAGAALFAWLLIGVVFLTTVWRYPEWQAGLAVSPGAVAAALSASATGRLTARGGYRWAVLGGSLMVAATGVWLSQDISARPAFLDLWLPAGILSGVGFGMILPSLTSVAALSVQPLHLAGAMGLNLTARQIGGALGIAVLATILQTQLSSGLAAFAHVFLFCAVAAGAAAASSLGLPVHLHADSAARQAQLTVA